MNLLTPVNTGSCFMRCESIGPSHFVLFTLTSNGLLFCKGLPLFKLEMLGFEPQASCILLFVYTIFLFVVCTTIYLSEEKQDINYLEYIFVKSQQFKYWDFFGFFFSFFFLVHFFLSFSFSFLLVSKRTFWFSQSYSHIK